MDLVDTEAPEAPEDTEAPAAPADSEAPAAREDSADTDLPWVAECALPWDIAPRRPHRPWVDGIARPAPAAAAVFCPSSP